ncbi:MAG: hypothetical protein FJ387_26365 [Verrucomicrobia bacterium]|nr:hypothetical protein [Verrucomicrobiota bacterium]
MVSQKENRLDFADLLDNGKIFLAKLAHGGIGKENSFLLGSLLLAKLQQTAMSRQRQAAGARRDFWLYIDEFHNFITASMAEILTGARKYRVDLILAHQELRQLQRDKPRKQKIQLGTADLTEADRKQIEKTMLNRLAEAMKRKKA